MNWLVNNIVSLFSRDGNWDSLAGIDHGSDLLVSGYVDPVGDKDSREFPSTNLQRKQAAVLYADISNYARLIEQDEEGTHRRLVKAITIMMSHVADNKGRIAHLAGDAILAEFEDADSALHCAINVQLAARQWNADLYRDQQVLFRIGVNFGDVITDRGDIFGNTENLTARLEKLACSGGVCVSESIREELDDHSSFKFVALGKQYVKNISEPVQVFWIEIDAQQIVDPDFTGAVKISPATS